MGERLLLVDSDIFIILSAAGVFERTAEVLAFDLADVRRLPALERQLRRGTEFRRKYPSEVRDAALSSALRVPALTERPRDTGILDQLRPVSDIDEGEAVLYALMCERPSYLLASGDKRAMRALAARAEVRNVRDALAGRIICLEAAVRALVRRDGVAQVADAFTPLRSVNQTLSVVFSQGSATTERDCLTALDSYLRDLKNDLGDDFLLIP